MIHSENDLKHACIRASIFATNHAYHNCLLESFHLENPSVQKGWRSAMGNRDHLTIAPQRPECENRPGHHEPPSAHRIAPTHGRPWRTATPRIPLDR